MNDEQRQHHKTELEYAVATCVLSLGGLLALIVFGWLASKWVGL